MPDPRPEVRCSPRDPCSPSPCGPGTSCAPNTYGDPICRCLPGLVPKPDTITGAGRGALKREIKTVVPCYSF